LKFQNKEQNVEILEEGSSNILEDSVRKFKSKAVGGEVEDFEQILRKELRKKNTEFTKQFNDF